MNFKIWLIEAEYKDVRNTYKDLMDYLEKSPEELFVNFSDRPKGLFVASKNPGHYDPIGIYGFSKEYMQRDKNQNQGFWGLPYITVFRPKSSAKILNLDTVTVDEAKQLLKKMGIEDYIEKPWHRKPANNSGGALLWNTMEKYNALNGLHKNSSWNGLFKKIGVDVIRDTKSVIHHNEPDQIIVLNPSQAEIVKTVEKPLNQWQQKIQKQMYDLLNELGQKYLKDFKITSRKRGSAEITRKYPKHELASNPDIWMAATSTNTEIPLIIELNYSAYNGTLRGYINDQSKNDYLFNAEIRAERGSSWDQINVIDLDFNDMKKQMENALDKITQEISSSEINKAEKIQNKIINQLDFANFKTRYDSGRYQSVAQFKVGNTPSMLKIVSAPSKTGVTINIVFSFIGRDSYSGKNVSKKISFEPISFNVNDENDIDIKYELKKLISHKIDILSKDEWSGFFEREMKAIKGLLKLL